MGKRHLLVVREGEKGRTVPESRITQEVDLQEAFKEHPELIPVGDLGLGPLLVVGRETTVGSGGAVDLLAVDPKGRVIVAEFKRGPENSDSRQVVAQVLEYASWLCGMSYEDFDDGIAQPFFRGHHCTDTKVHGARDLEHAAVVHWTDEDSFSVEEFRQGVTTALTDGALECVVISSEIDRNTRRVLGFLNLTSRFRCHGIEVDHFSDGERRVFVPRATVIPPGPTDRPTPPKTTRENFLAACSDAARRFFSEVLRYMDHAPGEISWGTRGFSFHIQVGDARPRIFYGYPRGTVGHKSDYAQVVTSDLRKADVAQGILEDYTGSVADLSVVSRTEAGNITFDVDEKTDEKATQVFLQAMGRLIEAVM